jgi:hypothetical protein
MTLVRVFRALVTARWRSTWNAAIGSSGARRAGVVSFGVLFGFFVVEFTPEVASVYRAAPDTQLAALNFAAVLVFLAAHAVSSSLHRLTGAPDALMLGALPVPVPALFALRLLDVVWDIGRALLVPLPVYLGYGMARGLNASGWFVYAFGWGLVWLFLAASGLLVALCVARFLRAGLGRAAFRAASVAVTLGLMVGMMFYASGSGGRSLASAHEAAASLRPLLEWLPTTWVARSAGPTRAPAWCLFLVVLSAGTTTLAAVAFRRLFHVEYASPVPRMPRRRARSRGARRPWPPVLALFVKEWRIASRSPQLLFGWIAPVVLALAFAWIAGGSGLAERNHLFVMVVVAFPLTLLLALPAVGREGRDFALLRVYLRSTAALVGAKAAFAAVASFPVVLVGASGWLLGRVSWALLLDALVVSVAFGAFGVGVGALTPRFDESNPLRAVGLGGFVALYLYFSASVAVSGVLFSAPGQGRAGMAALAAVGVAVLALGSRRLDRRDAP